MHKHRGRTHTKWKEGKHLMDEYRKVASLDKSAAFFLFPPCRVYGPASLLLHSGRTYSSPNFDIMRWQ